MSAHVIVGGEEVHGEDIINPESSDCKTELDKVRKQLKLKTVIMQS